MRGKAGTDQDETVENFGVRVQEIGLHIRVGAQSAREHGVARDRPKMVIGQRLQRAPAFAINTTIADVDHADFF